MPASLYTAQSCTCVAGRLLEAEIFFFRVADAHVLTHGLDALVDDEEEEKDEEV